MPPSVPVAATVVMPDPAPEPVVLLASRLPALTVVAGASAGLRFRLEAGETGIGRAQEPASEHGELVA